MKVNVSQVNDTKFRKFAWWSNWIDVAVFDFESAPYLLQMSISRTNKKKFNAIRITGTLAYRQATCQSIGDLSQMSKSE